MSLGAQIRGMQAAVKRLEAAAGKGRHCPHCRLTKRHSLPDPKKPRPRPEDVLKDKCEFCGAEATANLTEVPEGEREAYRLLFSYTLEDEYTDPRAQAVVLWLRHRPEREPNNKRRPAARAKNDANARLLAKLREEAGELYDRKIKRLRSKYGESPFQEQHDLIKAVEDRQHIKGAEDHRVAGLYEMRRAETGYLICAELEKIIWGSTTQETAAAIERLGQEIEELTAAAMEKQDREKEEFRLANLEFLNKNRARLGRPPLPDDYGKS